MRSTPTASACWGCPRAPVRLWTSTRCWPTIPSNREPPRTECEHVIESIRSGTSAILDGEAGLRAMCVLEACSIHSTKLADGVARTVALTSR